MKIYYYIAQPYMSIPYYLSDTPLYLLLISYVRSLHHVDSQQFTDITEALIKAAIILSDNMQQLLKCMHFASCQKHILDI